MYLHGNLHLVCHYVSVCRFPAQQPQCIRSAEEEENEEEEVEEEEEEAEEKEKEAEEEEAEEEE